MLAARNSPEQVSLASVEHDHDVRRNARRAPHRFEGFCNLAEPRDIVQSCHNDEVADGKDLVGPVMPGWWQINAYEIVPLRNLMKEGVKRSDMQRDRLRAVAGRCEHIDAGCHMP